MSNYDQANLPATFRKSSFSGGGNCVEVQIRKESPCDESGIEVQVRDSKDPDGPVLSFNESEWRAFLAGTHNHEFDIDRNEPGDA